MKPIPAIDEAGNWIEARLTNGALVILVALGEDYAITLQGEFGVRFPSNAIQGFHILRERVERARGERERVAREDAKRLEAFGVEDRTDAGVKVTYSPSGAASVDSRELFEKVIEPLLAESQRRQAIRAHAGVDEPRRPSFAEALEAEFSKDKEHDFHVSARGMLARIRAARAASGE